MTDLIKIDTNRFGKQTVNARDLHEFLEVKTQFSDWITKRIKEYGFINNIDYLKISNENHSGIGPAPIEYHISLDMAKELSMVERNEKGKQARQYFIECEKKAKDPMIALNDPEILRKTLLTYTEKVIELETTVKYQAPKVAALDRISTADGSMCITDAAKHLQVRPKDLFKWLSRNKWIYKRAGGKHWIAYQTILQKNLMKHKIMTTEVDGKERVFEQVRITAEGLTKIAFEMEVEMDV